MEHPDVTCCPVCRVALPLCRWTGLRFVTLCHGVEPRKPAEMAPA